MTTDSAIEIRIGGVVQGVGFRPFVYGLAAELGLAGTVANSIAGVEIFAEGNENQLGEFLARLRTEAPPHAVIERFETAACAGRGAVGFRIVESHADPAARGALILPDLATCDDCRREIFDAGNRRFRYPFTVCTRCGPRFSIIDSLPYDRARTSMAAFAMCVVCRAEYENPADRRFHAEPTACPACGPQVALWAATGEVLAVRDAAILAAVEAIRAGNILAVKGLGGFHLVADAANETAIATLRARKHRPAKPMAVMVPDLETARAWCDISPAEEDLLTSPPSPIVLLKRREAAKQAAPGPARNVAPLGPFIGVMLPYTPLHLLLLHDFGGAIVATSGNISEAPIEIDECRAIARENLGAIADVFLVHDRPIRRPVDDSVARVVDGKPLLIRRARGFAPLPMPLPTPPPAANEQPPATVLAVGAQQKITVALALGERAVISPHIGDVHLAATFERHAEMCAALPRLFGETPEIFAADKHPDYLATRTAESLASRETPGRAVVRVQHHVAHVLAAMAEHRLAGPVLGVAWDGTGFGDDGTIWGGEFLAIERDFSYRRVAALRPFPLLGGDSAVVDPRRAALGLVWDGFGERGFDDVAGGGEWFGESERRVFRQMLSRGTNCPRCSSMGRLFDAVAALSGACAREISFEGEAAASLEFTTDAEAVANSEPYPLPLSSPNSTGISLLDWQPLVAAIRADVRDGASVGAVSARFHAGLVAAMGAVARAVGVRDVVLTGGCFQNAILLSGAINWLRAHGFSPAWPEQVPANDGGISYGQLVAARSRVFRGE